MGAKRVTNGYFLGIDVGTTRTAAAIGRPGMRASDAEVVNLGDRASAVPSVLYVANDGSVVVGEAAERRATTEPAHVVREFKRRIGDPTPVVVAGRGWAPEELSARLTRWVVDRTAQREGGPAARVAVTHPASWGKHKLDLFGTALAHQGIPVSFLAEPQAAALHYAAAERVEPGSTIAVYDFGGGTFDAAIVHKDASGGFSLVGRPEGVDRLGGVDFDEVVFEHVREGLPEAFEGLDENDPAVLAAVAAVRRECTEAKEALSSDTEVSISVMMPGARGSVRLHRSEFEAMIRPQVEETVSVLRRAIASAGLSPEQLSTVLLVGGSSRIPLVGQLVSEQLGRPVAVDADPKNAIAKGAAVSLMPVVASPTGAHVPAPRAGAPVHAPTGAVGVAAPGGAPAMRPGMPPMGTGAFPSPAPPAQRVSASGAMPARFSAPPPPPPRQAFPERPALDYDPADVEYETRRSKRSPALLVSAGGAAAAVAVIAAVFIWPKTATTPTTNVSTPPDTTISAPATPTDTPPGPTSDNKQAGDGRPNPPVPPKQTTPPPIATTAPPTTAPPTTTPPPPTTKPPVTTTAPPTTKPPVTTPALPTTKPGGLLG